MSAVPTASRRLAAALLPVGAVLATVTGALPAAGAGVRPADDDTDHRLYWGLPVRDVAGCATASLGITGLGASRYPRPAGAVGHVVVRRSAPGTRFQLVAEVRDAGGALVRVTRTVTAGTRGPRDLTVDFADVPVGGSVVFRGTSCAGGTCPGVHRAGRADPGAVVVGGLRRLARV